jgi:DNA transformation protein and related proteins
MAVSDGFIKYVLDQLSGWGQVSVRRMFGGAGLYREGRMFGLIADDVAYLKVDDSNRDAFVKAGCSPFTPYPDRVKTTVMSYYEIPPEVLEDPDELARWAQRSLAIQATKKDRGQRGPGEPTRRAVGRPRRLPG